MSSPGLFCVNPSSSLRSEDSVCPLERKTSVLESGTAHDVKGLLSK